MGEQWGNKLQESREWKPFVSLLRNVCPTSQKIRKEREGWKRDCMQEIPSTLDKTQEVPPS